MTFEEFVEWVQVLVIEDRLTPQRGADVIEQRRLFDLQRSGIEEAYQGQSVGLVRGELVTAFSIPTLLELVAERFEDQVIYFEPIGYRAF